MLQLTDIRKLLEESQAREALEALRTWASLHLPDKTVDVELQLARVNMCIQTFTKGLVTMPEYKTELLNITKGVLILLSECENASSQDSSSTTAALHEYHSYTCDRIDHSDAFKQVYNAAPKNPQFFFLYGGDMQSHEGFFRRTSYDLEGRLQDYLNSDIVSSSQALQLEMTFEASRQLDIYKQNVLKSFFSMFGLSANDHEPLTDKNFNYVLDRSPRTNGLEKNDFVCVYIHISEYDWDPELTPQAASWFIHDFCKDEISEDAPSILVFFALEYDEEDEQIRSEVQATIKESDTVQALPELGMVVKRDIGQWLERYKQVAANTKERKKLLKTICGDSDEHYMEDVEIELKKIIDQHNNNQVK